MNVIAFAPKPKEAPPVQVCSWRLFMDPTDYTISTELLDINGDVVAIVVHELLGAVPQTGWHWDKADILEQMKQAWARCGCSQEAS